MQHSHCVLLVKCECMKKIELQKENILTMYGADLRGHLFDQHVVNHTIPISVRSVKQ